MKRLTKNKIIVEDLSKIKVFSENSPYILYCNRSDKMANLVRDSVPWDIVQNLQQKLLVQTSIEVKITETATQWSRQSMGVAQLVPYVSGH